MKSMLVINVIKGEKFLELEKGLRSWSCFAYKFYCYWTQGDVYISCLLRDSCLLCIHQGSVSVKKKGGWCWGKSLEEVGPMTSVLSEIAVTAFINVKRFFKLK